MPRRAKGLSAQGVQKAKPGRYGDGAGLYLLVRAPDAKFWVFRYTRFGRMREMGLGPATGKTAVLLADARKRALALYNLVRDGVDPLDQRRAARTAQRVDAAKADAATMTFRQCADAYIEAHRAGWKNAKHEAQWPATLKTYAYPVMGTLPVATVDTALVLKVLQPIWATKTETAGRVRARIEAVLDWAKVAGYRDGDNPAVWKGNLAALLPKRGKVHKVRHHAALPYAEIGEFMTALRGHEGVPARVLEFAILTAARTGEAIGARWEEIDLDGKMWTVPAERIKAGKEHRVPLGARAVEIIKAQRGRDPVYVFPGRKRGKPLSNMAMLKVLERMWRSDITTHGFRSSFRDWAAERTNYPSEVAEMALAHKVGDKVEAAYRRGDMFEKRRWLADEWAKFCAQPAAKGGVAAIRKRG
jgi:integrase